MPDTSTTAPHDWCPECDSAPGACPPGTCPGRPFPSLAEAEVIARGVASLNPWVVSLLAEYDRRGAELDREPSALAIVQAQLRAVRQEFQGVATENAKLRQERDAYRQIANLAIDSMNRLAGYDTNYAGSDRGDG